MLKSIALGLFVVAVPSMASAASCSLPTVPDVIGNCVCPNPPERAKLLASFPQLATMCPLASSVSLERKYANDSIRDVKDALRAACAEGIQDACEAL